MIRLDYMEFQKHRTQARSHRSSLRAARICPFSPGHWHLKNRTCFQLFSGVRQSLNVDCRTQSGTEHSIDCPVSEKEIDLSAVRGLRSGHRAVDVLPA